MRISRAVIAGLALMLACSVANAGKPSKAERNAALYQQSLEAVQAKLDSEALIETERMKYAQTTAKAFADACAQDKNPRECVKDVAMLLTFGQAMDSMARMAGSRNTDAMPQAPYERDGAAKFRDVMGAMMPMFTTGMSVWRDDRQGQRNADIALSHDAMLGGIVQSAIGATSGAASAAIANASPVYNVGGDMIGGDRVETNIGDDYTGGDRSEVAVGGDQVGRDQRIGDDVGRDQIGGDRIDNSGIIGSGNEQRIGSPGPIDDHSDDGDDCTGSDCSQPPPAKSFVPVLPESEDDKLREIEHQLDLMNIKLEVIDAKAEMGARR